MVVAYTRVICDNSHRIVSQADVPWEICSVVYIVDHAEWLDNSRLILYDSIFVYVIADFGLICQSHLSYKFCSCPANLDKCEDLFYSYVSISILM